MLFDVYNLGTDTAGLGPLSAGPVRGELAIRKRFPNSPHDDGVTATLSAPGTKNTLLQPLHYVRFVAMNSHSMVIEGTVVSARGESPKAKVSHYKVRWLCKFPDAPAVVNTSKLQDRHSQLKRAIDSDPIHPAHDDAPEPTYGPLDDSIG